MATRSKKPRRATSLRDSARAGLVGGLCGLVAIGVENVVDGDPLWVVALTFGLVAGVLLLGYRETAARTGLRRGQALPLRHQGLGAPPLAGDFSGRIVGYSIGDRMKSRLAVDALNSAVARRGGVNQVAGCIVHSDRGSQFRSRRVLAELRHHDLVGSMGQVASAGDNAAMESFFALLQKNVLDRHRWTTRAELRIAIVTWIERTYHRRRRQARLGRLTPIEYETINAPQVALAA